MTGKTFLMFNWNKIKIKILYWLSIKELFHQPTHHLYLPLWVILHSTVICDVFLNFQKKEKKKGNLHEFRAVMIDNQSQWIGYWKISNHPKILISTINDIDERDASWMPIYLEMTGSCRKWMCRKFHLPVSSKLTIWGELQNDFSTW